MITHDIAEAVSVSDRIIILSKRPATVKDIVTINLNKSDKPTKKRNDENFKNYYELIWKKIDKNG